MISTIFKTELLACIVINLIYLVKSDRYELVGYLGQKSSIFPTGFVTVKNATDFISFTDQPLLDATTTNVQGIVPCSVHHRCAILYGHYGFVGSMVSNNLVLLNFSTPDEPFFQPLTGIGSYRGQLCSSRFGEDEILIAGPSIYLLDHPFLQIGSLLVCNYIKDYCYEFPDPFVDRARVQDWKQCSIHVIGNNTIYISFSNYISMWEKGNGWKTVIDSPGAKFGVSLIYGDYPLIGDNNLQLSSENVTICNSSNLIKYVAVWNGHCWGSSEKLEASFPFNGIDNFRMIPARSNLFLVTDWLWIFNDTSSQWINITSSFINSCESVNAKQNIQKCESLDNTIRCPCSNYLILNLSNMKWVETQSEGSSEFSESGEYILWDDMILQTVLISSPYNYYVGTINMTTEFVDNIIVPTLTVTVGSIDRMCAWQSELVVSGLFTQTFDNSISFYAYADSKSHKWEQIQLYSVGGSGSSFGCDSSSTFVSYINQWNQITVTKINLYSQLISTTMSYSDDLLHVCCFITIGNFIFVGGSSSVGSSRVIIFDWSRQMVPSSSTLLCFGHSTIQCVAGMSGNEIYSLGTDGKYLYIGGKFSFQQGRVMYTNIAKYDPKNQSWLEVGPLFGVVSTMITMDGHLLVGGSSLLNSTTNLAILDTDGNWREYGNCTKHGLIRNLKYDPIDSILYVLYNDGTLEIIQNGQNSIVQNLSFQNMALLHYVDPKELTTLKQNQDHKNKNYLWWILGVTGGVMLIISIMMITLLMRKSKYKYIEIPDYRNSVIDQQKIDLIEKDPSIPKIPRNNFILKDRLGIGGQGEVRKAIANGKVVAAKSLHCFDDDLSTSDFLREIKLLSSLSHENIVKFYGIGFSEERIWMVTELMDVTLADIISDIDTPNKLRILLSIARAMKYLHHEIQPPILHRDLKPSNILVDRDGKCKLTDFGASKLLSKASTTTRPVGTIMYIAPEALQGKYSEKSDVFSFGVIMMELVEGKHPYSNVIKQCANEWEFSRKMINKEFEIDISKIFQIHEPFALLAQSCLDWNPSNRPNFINIVDTLVRIV